MIRVGLEFRPRQNPKSRSEALNSTVISRFKALYVGPLMLIDCSLLTDHSIHFTVVSGYILLQGSNYLMFRWILHRKLSSTQCPKHTKYVIPLSPSYCKHCNNLIVKLFVNLKKRCSTYISWWSSFYPSKGNQNNFMFCKKTLSPIVLKLVSCDSFLKWIQ